MFFKFIYKRHNADIAQRVIWLSEQRVLCVVHIFNP